MPASHYIASLSEHAFFTIVTSALEAYRVSHPNNENEEHIPKETYGNLWGYQAKSKRKETVFHISFADVDIAADRQPGSVKPHPESFQIKEHFVDTFKPEVEYMGDFHSHPYDLKNDKVRSVLSVEREDLCSFSDADHEHVKHLKKTRKYRVGLVATVLETAKPRESKHVGSTSYNCIRFSYDKFTIWIKCYLYDGKKMVDESDVSLLCPAAGFHAGTIEQETA